MIFKVTILGSNSAIPTMKRNPTSQLVNHNERFFLVDCAEGTQTQLRKNKIRFQRINHIFISHLHGDHFFGLIGLISSMHLLGRKKELHIYGPVLLENIIQIQLEASQTELIYPLIFHTINPEVHEQIYEDEKLVISTIPLDHRIPTCGFLFKEKKGKRKIKRDIIRNFDIAVDKFINIKNGEDIMDQNGKVVKNKEITDDPPPARSYAYCSDTGYFESIIPVVKNVDLLYHETTFAHDLVEVAREKFHSTSVDAATIAKKANVKKLIIGHFSTRYDSTDELLSEAQQIFKNTEVAIDGKSFEI
ncbi:MAG: ribonuclease Z [Bacteroidetes bacterium 4484_249]|nr:MAG: ribonuclease Z [Bacteroidetes bacterium 4484_249]